MTVGRYERRPGDRRTSVKCVVVEEARWLLTERYEDMVVHRANTVKQE